MNLLYQREEWGEEGGEGIEGEGIGSNNRQMPTIEVR